MSDPKPLQKKSFSLDWLVRGALTRIGDTFDRLTGRGWKPSSSLATSELIERLKKLLDSDVKDIAGEGRFVPHNIKLKMQWDKFSTDSETAITKLENELLTAAIDHINENRYHTYAPLTLEVKPDYFTEGVKLLASYENFAGEEHEAELNVTIPGMKVADLIPESAAAKVDEKTYFAVFAAGAGQQRVELVFPTNERKGVGRAKTNDLLIEDHSVTSYHASLALNAEGRLIVADTGSTNGTFVNGQRISQGETHPVAEGDVVRFGLVEVRFEHAAKQAAAPAVEEVDISSEETVAIGEFEFRKKDSALGDPGPLPGSPAQTDAAALPGETAPIPKPPEHGRITEILRPATIPQAAFAPPETDVDPIDSTGPLDKEEEKQ